MTRAVSPRAAIAAKCRDCICDPFAPGNWRQQVGRCAIPRCALHPFRPVSTSKRSRGGAVSDLSPSRGDVGMAPGVDGGESSPRAGA